MGPIEEFRDEVDPIVFTFGAGLALLFIALFLLVPDTFVSAVSGLQAFVLSNFNWGYLIVMLFFLLFLGFLIVGPWGNLRFGDESPEYSYFSYFAMLYSAGLAAGTAFWGPTEALLHYGNVPPLYGEVADKSAAAIPIAVQYSAFHWMFTQYVGFTLFGIGIGYYVYNHGAPLRVSSILTPFIGADSIKDSNWATLVDVLAVFATLGGVATSLGFIGRQFLTGLEYQWGVALGDAGTMLVITGMTVLFTISLLLGVDRGIRRLSDFNMVLFFVLMVATLIVGPTVFILQTSVNAMSGVITDFFSMSLFLDTANNNSWANSWTVFFWAWPLAWSPFVGLFIARISRGRSVREVAFTGTGAMGLASVPWFIILGTTGVWLQHTGRANLLGPINRLGESVSGYVLYSALPLGSLLLVGFIVLIVTFFVTSADSSSLALAMLTTGGKKSPSAISRVFWAVLLGAVAAILILIGKANAFQSAAAITALPIAVLGLVTIIGLTKSFRQQYGNLLLQEETVLFGTSTRSSSQNPPDAEATEDD
ncbi:BCCT family transporter [Halococcus sp. AFM35]|uniref:BCCT family transporter n=1 Tax=Halococcus sp. AFM35 TaxID=3421653 RepID=UPI003EC0CC25